MSHGDKSFFARFPLLSPANKKQQHMSSGADQPPPLIWFQLYDAETGQPYKNSTVAAVVRASLAVEVVEVFRDAVKAKFADSLLLGIAPNLLLVYSNKASLDMRNAQVDRSSPLAASGPLVRPATDEEIQRGAGEQVPLGATEHDAIAVAVPPPPSPALSKRDLDGNLTCRSLS